MVVRNEAPDLGQMERKSAPTVGGMWCKTLAPHHVREEDGVADLFFSLAT
jgi:hypothetical protein